MFYAKRMCIHVCFPRWWMKSLLEPWLATQIYGYFRSNRTDTHVKNTVLSFLQPGTIFAGNGKRQLSYLFLLTHMPPWRALCLKWWCKEQTILVKSVVLIWWKFTIPTSTVCHFNRLEPSATMVCFPFVIQRKLPLSYSDFENGAQNSRGQTSEKKRLHGRDSFYKVLPEDLTEVKGVEIRI